MASIYDIAKEAGVAYSTVSLILNNRGDAVRISKKTQERVKKIAKEMGYVPNISARKLISKDIENIPEIALFWSPNQHPIFLNSLISKLNDLVKTKQIHSMSVTIYPFEIGHLDMMEKILCGNFSHGLIIPTAHKDDIRFLEHTDIQTPVITLYADTKKYHSIDVDNYANGQMAAKIFKYAGITKVGIVKNVYLSLGSKERMQGFKDYCLKHGMNGISEIGLPLSRDKMVTTGLQRYQRGEQMIEKLLLGKHEIPHGIFVQDDDSARGVLNAFKKHGISVPGEVAIISYGYNTPENEEYNRLTLVDFPIEELTGQTWKLMSDILEGKIESVQRIRLSSNICFGQSCPRPDGWI